MGLNKNLLTAYFKHLFAAALPAIIPVRKACVFRASRDLLANRGEFQILLI
jgi:hypothetical protein